MAYAFQVPRQRTRPLTQGAQLAEDQNTQGLATGNFSDVQSARGATDRSNALRTSQALQATRGTFARSGVDTSPEAAARAQDQSFSAAEGQNLNGTNAVNQLQRQYRNDAVTNANQYEAAANQRQQQGISNDQFQQTFGANREDAATARNQFDKTYGANREDAATARNQFGLNYNAGREDANTAKNQFGETMAQRKNEFGVSSGQSQQQIDNQSKQFLTSQAQRDKEFGQTFAAGREDAADSRSRFDLTRGDTNTQFDKTLGQRQNEFGVSSSQQQQQIDNQAEQAAKKLGYDYNALSQNDKQFFQKMAQEDSQFSTKTNFDYNSLNQTLGENARQFDAKLGQEGSQFQSKLRQDENQFGVTSGMTQQQIDNQRNQFDKNYAQSGSQFDQTLAQNKSQFDLTRGDKQKSMTMDEINTIQDPVARNQALKAYYSGGNVGDTISGNIDANGQLIKHAASPGEAAFQAKVDAMKAYNPKLMSEDGRMETDQAYNDRLTKKAQDYFSKQDTIAGGVTDSGEKALYTQKAKDKYLSSPNDLTPSEKNLLVESGDIKSYQSEAGIPVGDEAQGMSGQQIKVGNDYYKINSGGSVITKWNGAGRDNNHKDYSELTSPTGKTVYMVDGKITDKKPVDEKKPSKLDNYVSAHLPPFGW